MAALLAPLLSITTLFGSLFTLTFPVEEALRRGRLTLDRQQDVDSLALHVDSAVEVSQTPLTLKYVSSMCQLPVRALVFPAQLLDE